MGNINKLALIDRARLGLNKVTNRVALTQLESPDLVDALDKVDKIPNYGGQLTMFDELGGLLPTGHTLDNVIYHRYINLDTGNDLNTGLSPDQAWKTYDVSKFNNQNQNFYILHITGDKTTSYDKFSIKSFIGYIIIDDISIKLYLDRCKATISLTNTNKLIYLSAKDSDLYTKYYVLPYKGGNYDFLRCTGILYLYASPEDETTSYHSIVESNLHLYIYRDNSLKLTKDNLEIISSIINLECDINYKSGKISNNYSSIYQLSGTCRIYNLHGEESDTYYVDSRRPTKAYLGEIVEANIYTGLSRDNPTNNIADTDLSSYVGTIQLIALKSVTPTIKRKGTYYVTGKTLILTGYKDNSKLANGVIIKGDTTIEYYTSDSNSKCWINLNNPNSYILIKDRELHIYNANIENYSTQGGVVYHNCTIVTPNSSQNVFYDKFDQVKLTDETLFDSEVLIDYDGSTITLWNYEGRILEGLGKDTVLRNCNIKYY